MSPVTSVRLALSGTRSDSVRIALTAFGAGLATLTLLAAATVLSITIKAKVIKFTRPEDGLEYEMLETTRHYTNNLLNEEGLRPGVSIALILMTIPIMAFVAQCGRLGAPARDRRLAAMRMAGATPRQARWVAAVETGASSILGVALGFGAYFAGRALLDKPNAQGLRTLPTDVLPPWPALVAVGVGVPLFVTLFALFALRRVVVTPLGVVRTQRRDAPGPWPGLLIAGGIGALAIVQPLHRYVLKNSPGAAGTITVAILVIAMLMLSVGVVSGTGWITYFSGRVLGRLARRPSTLLAGRRMMADPWAGSRTFAAMLVAMVFGAGTAAMYAWTFTDFRVQDALNRKEADYYGEPYFVDDRSFYLRAFELIGYALSVAVVIAALGLLVALADGIVSRRRQLSALVATGTPRGVLAKATMWQVLTPVLPALLLAASIGVILPAWILGESGGTGGGGTRCVPDAGDPIEACADPAYYESHAVVGPEFSVTMSVPVPWEQLGMLVGGAFVATALVTAIGLLFLRSSTTVTELRTT